MLELERLEFMRQAVIWLGLVTITISFCLLFYPPVTEKFKKLLNKKPINNPKFRPADNKLIPAIFGTGLLIEGLIFCLEFNVRGRINYFFKIPVEVTDPFGAFLLYGSLMTFGMWLMAKNIISIKKDHQIWKTEHNFNRSASDGLR